MEFRRNLHRSSVLSLGLNVAGVLNNIAAHRCSTVSADDYTILELDCHDGRLPCALNVH
jgi:hypothetical protein